MAVITISRGTYSGGRALAAALAQRLGYRAIDREAVLAHTAPCGASEDKLREAIEKPPGFLDHFTEERRRYMVLFQACLAEEARKDNLIYLGNAGHLLLHGVDHVLRVRIIAPLEYRIAALQESHGVDRGEAIAEIEKRDHGRARWTRFLYGVDWSDPAFYDVVFNLARSTIEDACNTLSTLACQPSFRPTPESQAAIEDLALASRVHAALIVHPQTGSLILDVAARDGVVKLSGKVRNHKQLEAVKQVAAETSGVATVVTDELIQVLDS